MGESKYGVGRIVPVLVDGFLFYLTNGFTRPSKYAVGKLSFILLNYPLYTQVYLNLEIQILFLPCLYIQDG